MKTTVDHLLTPRFEVIADYPGTMRNIGSVIDSDYTFLTHNDKGYPAQFPHLFRPLQWWEKRTKEDMPKYLKEKRGNDLKYYQVKKWGRENKKFTSDQSFGYTLLDICFEPCSEEEYLANVKP